MEARQDTQKFDHCRCDSGKAPVSLGEAEHRTGWRQRLKDQVEKSGCEPACYPKATLQEQKLDLFPVDGKH